MVLSEHEIMIEILQYVGGPAIYPDADALFPSESLYPLGGPIVLYPSNDIYPRTDLYPRNGLNLLYPSNTLYPNDGSGLFPNDDFYPIGELYPNNALLPLSDNSIIPFASDLFPSSGMGGLYPGGTGEGRARGLRYQLVIFCIAYSFLEASSLDDPSPTIHKLMQLIEQNFDLGGGSRREKLMRLRNIIV